MSHILTGGYPNTFQTRSKSHIFSLRMELPFRFILNFSECIDSISLTPFQYGKRNLSHLSDDSCTAVLRVSMDFTLCSNIQLQIMKENLAFPTQHLQFVITFSYHTSASIINQSILYHGLNVSTLHGINMPY